MRKLFIAGLGVSIILFTGCGNNNPQPQQSFQCQIEGQNAPAWVCDGGASMEGGIFAVGSAVGSAEKSPLGISFQRQEAMANARDALAREIEVKVKNMFKSYMSSTGIGDNQTAERVATSVSKQLSKQVLRGSKLLKTWMSKNGTMYVLVGMTDTNKLKNELKKAAKTTFKNNEALWQEFKAKRAQQELDSEIDKEFGDGNAQ